ncbi:hypothetical protein Micbo1qcDRAFT_29320 [Microdochium bolleyi]|uniref:Uncharacterized protein n=1 Tax=Microdochium bolleyi TaxID=196109 RepID=A0A136JFE1_9PEZI|nr:hypothetical protein Micbo1qcDRAFT_29320 [Microdochium bolleyi]
MTPGEGHVRGGECSLCGLYAARVRMGNLRCWVFRVYNLGAVYRCWCCCSSPLSSLLFSRSLDFLASALFCHVSWSLCADHRNAGDVLLRVCRVRNVVADLCVVIIVVTICVCCVVSVVEVREICRCRYIGFVG